MDSTKGAHELQKKNLSDKQGAVKIGPQTDLPLIHDVTTARL